MSREVHIDGRTIQLMDCHRVIQSAISELGARRSQANCGHADVRLSHVNVDAAVSAFHQARNRDRLEEVQTDALQEKLKKDAPDYDASVLGDWKPDVSVPPIKVEENVTVQSDGRRLVEMLDVAAFDDPAAGVVGATLSVFEVDDGGGGKSFEYGLDAILFDENGDWKSNKAKRAWEAFLARQIQAEDKGSKKVEPPARRVPAAMKAAGLLEKKRERVPGGRTQTVYGTPAAEKKPQAKTMGVERPRVK